MPNGPATLEISGDDPPIFQEMKKTRNEKQKSKISPAGTEPLAETLRKSHSSI